MGRIVLVHGAWHGSWCWDAVVGGLRGRGHQVRATELNRGSLQLDILAAQKDVDDLGPDVLVCGHSYGGMVISGLRPEGIRELVYLTAIVPEVGESALDVAALAGSTVDLAEAIQMRDDGWCAIDPERASDLFYGDCAVADQRAAAERLTPHPLPSLRAMLDEVAWSSTPSMFVGCEADAVIPPDLQTILAERTTTHRCWPSAHSPFLSDPQRVVELLDSRAGN